MIVGAYGTDSSVFDVYVMLGAGLLCCAPGSFQMPSASLDLTLVLGPSMERSLNGSLQMSQGSFSIFHAVLAASTNDG
jgi:putative tricarboxylic transport membrane protein